MKKTLLILFLIGYLISSFAQQAHYDPSWESVKSKPFPQWFRDAKLGIFIHWSLSSVPAWSGKEQYAEWFLRGLLTGDSARIGFQKKVFGENFTYDQFAPLFKGELFNAGEWAELFANSGARYVVFVSKHHDGFCLWPSKYAKGWNAMDVGPHRDIVGELTEAVREKGLKMGLYYSLPEWNNVLYRWGTDPPEKVNRYIDEHMIPQFKELISTYKPSLLFTDGEWDYPASTWHSAELISWYYNLIGDEAIVNDRWGSGSEGVGFRTPEYSSGLTDSDRPWAEVRGLGRSFGLNRNETLDAYMTPAELIHFFVKAVANGGGIILNVGPYCDGQIPLLQQERLLQLGKWLKVNGEAIYGAETYSHPTEEKDVELKRIDQNINFDWVRNSPGKPIPEDDFTACWAGYIQPETDDEYSFKIIADDGARVWINGKLTATAGSMSIPLPTGIKEGKDNNVIHNIPLKAGQRYSIGIEYAESKQNANVQLWWSGHKVSKEIIPAALLYTGNTPSSSHGLLAVYHSHKPWLCYTRNHGNVYAVALEWPMDNQLSLSVDKPSTETKVRLLGREGLLPYKYQEGKMLVDLSSVKITELPCEWAWTFCIE